MPSIQVFDKKSLDYSTLAVNQEQILIISDAVDVSKFREVLMYVRIHDVPDIGGDAQLKIVAIRVAPSDEDPGIKFWVLEPVLATVTLDAATTGLSGSHGGLLAASFPENFGAYVGIGLMAVQDSSTQNIKATISVELVMKN